MKSRLLACVLLACCPPTVMALDPQRAVTQYIVDIWQTEQGLPQNSVQAVLQTSDGYLWLGTQEGLVRFDGIDFHVFDKTNTPALKNNQVLSLLEDRDGALWIGTNGGGVTRYQNRKFETFGREQGLSNEFVRCIDQDSEGRLWFGTDAGLNVRENNRFRPYTTSDGLAGDAVRAIIQDRMENLWIGTSSGLSRFRNGTFETFTTKQGLSHNSIRAIYEDRSGTLWIGTDEGLNRYQDGAFQSYKTEHGLPNNMIWSLHGDRDSNLWIGTYGGGLIRYRDNHFETFNSKNGLSNDIVWSIQEDREGSLWVGTLGGGLNRLKNGKFLTYTTSEGLSRDFTRTIYQDSSQRIWIGTYGGGLNLVQNGKISRFAEKDGLTNDLIWTIYADQRKNLWVGTYGGGLFQFANNRFRRYTSNEGLANNLIWSLQEDREGNLWIGTNGAGLARFRDGKFQTYTVADGLPSNLVFALFVDRSDALWIGTWGGGLSRWKDGKFTNFSTREGLSNQFVKCFYEDDDRNLWIGTANGGLNLYKNGKFSHFTTEEGLFDDTIHQILEDGSERLWLSCNKGIFSVNKRDLLSFAESRKVRIRVTSFTKMDGLRSNECNSGHPAGWKMQDGTLWFPTMKGVAIIDPEKISLNQQPPPVVLESMIVQGKETLGSDTKGMLELDPGKKTFEFHYAGLSFLEPRRVQFRYQLEGFDEKLVNAGTRRTAYYTNIPPGKYLFRVYASNNDGIWSQTGASIAFRLKPRFFQTPLFYVLAVFGTAFFGFVAYRLRVRHLKLRQQELLELVEERTKALAEAKERAERALAETEKARGELAVINQELEKANAMKTDLLNLAAHDLKNPLQTILGYSEIISREEQSQARDREMGALIHRASQRMLGLIDEVLDSAVVESGKLDIQKKALDLRLLAVNVISTYRHQAGNKRQKLNLIADRECIVKGDEKLLRQAIDNLVSNAVKYAPVETDIEVRVRQEDSTARVEVHDQGPGLTDQDKRNLFTKFQRLSARPTGGESSTGLGLSIAKQLVELHGGRILVDSTAGKGSTFIIELPL